MNWDQVFENNGYKPAATPVPSLPDPSVCENGQRPCNVPLVVDGETIGYCGRLIGWRVRWWRNSSRPVLRPHNGPHAVEWWSA